MAGETQDTRQKVGGDVWAKAAAISRDFKRILGNQFEKTWVKGTMISVNKKKQNEASKRSTTYVVARYPCEVQDGVQLYKEKEIPLQSLKNKDPNSVVPPGVDDVLEELASPAVVNNNSLHGTAAEAGGNPIFTPPPRAEAGNDLPPLQPPPTVGTTSTRTDERSTTTNTTASTGSTTRTPVTEQNGRGWFEGNTEVEVNGKSTTRFWKLVDQYGRGHEFTPGCDRAKKRYRAIDYFFAVFPKKQLQQMQERTSKKLISASPQPLEPTSIGKILKFMGILLLLTRFEFGNRASLWSTKGRNRFMPAPNFGHTTGMSRERFDALWRYMVWSEQEEERPEEMSHEEWRWSLVQDFVDNFNEHREAFYSASMLICADESISRWYGLGGNWINLGLPHYVAMDRKPENGCEIQNSCDGISGIMMRLKLVKSAAAEAATTEEQRRQAAVEEST